MDFTNHTDKLVIDLDNKTKMIWDVPSKQHYTKDSTHVTIYSFESKVPGIKGRPQKHEMHAVQTQHLLHVLLAL